MYSDTESGGGGERRVEISRGPRRTRDPLRESEWTSPALIHGRAQRRQSKCRHRDREGPHQVAAARDAGAGDAGGGDATIVVGKVTDNCIGQKMSYGVFVGSLYGRCRALAVG